MATAADNADADVKLYMTADIGDKFWRGEYNLGVGLAKGQVKAKGPVNKILKLVPLTKPLSRSTGSSSPRRTPPSKAA